MSQPARVRRLVLVACLLAGALSWTVTHAPEARAQAPAAPTIDTVASGDQSLTVAWSAPTVATGITAYDIRLIATSATDTEKAVSTNWTTIDDAWTSGRLAAIVTELTNDTEYDVQGPRGDHQRRRLVGHHNRHTTRPGPGSKNNRQRNAIRESTAPPRRARERYRCRRVPLSG